MNCYLNRTAAATSTTLSTIICYCATIAIVVVGSFAIVLMIALRFFVGIVWRKAPLKYLFIDFYFP